MFQTLVCTVGNRRLLKIQVFKKSFTIKFLDQIQNTFNCNTFNKDRPTTVITYLSILFFYFFFFDSRRKLKNLKVQCTAIKVGLGEKVISNITGYVLEHTCIQGWVLLSSYTCSKDLLKRQLYMFVLFAFKSIYLYGIFDTNTNCLRFPIACSKC